MAQDRELRHIVSVDDLPYDLLQKIWRRARILENYRSKRNERPQTLARCTMASVFFKESTRTRFSFEQAMSLLGGNTVTTESAGLFSSINKGETVEAMARVLDSFWFDVILVRHDEMGTAKKMAAVLTQTPLVNCGDGSGEHPTQAALDLYVIDDLLIEYPKLRENLTVTFAGDIKDGRTIRSLIRKLIQLQTDFALPTFYCVSPPALRMGDDLRADLTKSGVRFYEHDRLTRDIAAVSDILYLARTQDERKNGEMLPQDVIDGSAFAPTVEHVATMPEHTRIMHPQPYRCELPSWLHTDRRAYWENQAAGGLTIRMSLLEAIILNQ